MKILIFYRLNKHFMNWTIKRREVFIVQRRAELVSGFLRIYCTIAEITTIRTSVFLHS